KRLADHTLGTREAGALRIRRVTEQQVDAAVPQRRETPDVGAQSVDRRVVQLPVARVEDETRRGLDRDAHRVGDRMSHPTDLERERADSDRPVLWVDLT